MDLGLKDRVAIVAASSEGIGKAIAYGLAREGARVAICARTAAKVGDIGDEIHQATRSEVYAEALDVTVEEQVRVFVQRVAKSFGQVDICVTNAGGPPSKTFADATVEDWRRAVDLNFMSTLFFAREVLPLMKERRWGRLITITSLTVKQPVDGLILSNAVRAGVMGLVKSLSNEYAPFNVLVNNVCPGYTATARLKELVNTPEVEQRLTGRIPLGRFGTPEEIADLVVFLASERASYITGQSIVADGGFVKGL